MVGKIRCMINKMKGHAKMKPVIIYGCLFIVTSAIGIMNAQLLYIIRVGNCDNNSLHRIHTDLKSSYYSFFKYGYAISLVYVQYNNDSDSPYTYNRSVLTLFFSWN